MQQFSGAAATFPVSEEGGGEEWDWCVCGVMSELVLRGGAVATAGCWSAAGVGVLLMSGAQQCLCCSRADARLWGSAPKLGACRRRGNGIVTEVVCTASNKGADGEGMRVGTPLSMLGADCAT